ncbi:MAG: helix-turn-helix transcriptional regulator [Desulfoprunum sp.]|jgi:DNA-binding transcriptional regulator YiaG|uniref:helix-turn-helix domain-containing protein n=1 Tax=Desulfoprunum sp. TaxID=2020866 RepID=UPI003C77E398
MAQLVLELRKLTARIQEKFAARLDLTLPTINCWENDRAQLSPPALDKIESLLCNLRDKGKARHQEYCGKEG